MKKFFVDMHGEGDFYTAFPVKANSLAEALSLALAIVAGETTEHIVKIRIIEKKIQ